MSWAVAAGIALLAVASPVAAQDTKSPSQYNPIETAEVEAIVKAIEESGTAWVILNGPAAVAEGGSAATSAEGLAWDGLSEADLAALEQDPGLAFKRALEGADRVYVFSGVGTDGPAAMAGKKWTARVVEGGLAGSVLTQNTVSLEKKGLAALQDMLSKRGTGGVIVLENLQNGGSMDETIYPETGPVPGGRPDGYGVVPWSDTVFPGGGVNPSKPEDPMVVCYRAKQKLPFCQKYKDDPRCQCP